MSTGYVNRSAPRQALEMVAAPQCAPFAKSVVAKVEPEQLVLEIDDPIVAFFAYRDSTSEYDPRLAPVPF